MKTKLTLSTLVLAQALLISPPALAQPQPAPSQPAVRVLSRVSLSAKLRQIRLDTVAFDNVPLMEVIKSLASEAKKRDPENEGINFVIRKDPPEGTNGEPPDIAVALVKIQPPLQDLPLLDVLDAVVKAADHPIQYSIEPYCVVFSPQRVPSASNPIRFDFPGGDLSQFLSAVQDQCEVDWTSMADIPEEMRNVRIPKMRIFAEEATGPAEPARTLMALIRLYNELGEQKPGLGKLIVKGPLTKPSAVMFVPDKQMSELRPKIKVRAFNINGINEAGQKQLEEDIVRAKDLAIQYAVHKGSPAAEQTLSGTVAIHSQTSLLVATGSETFVDMVESIVSAWQAMERARNPGTPAAPAK